MAPKMEIRIGYGIGDFVFGMKRENVSSLLGEPDIEKTTDEAVDEPGVEWIYYEQKMTFRFYDDEDSKLGCIESENQNLTLFNEPIIGKKENEVIELMKVNGFQDYEREDYESFTTLDYNDTWLEFESTYDRIKRVMLSASFDEDDNYVWQYKAG